MGDDSNPGTSAAPWRTIGKAVATLGAGQTAIIMDGTYTEPMLRFGNSGTASAPITFMAQNKWKAIINSTADCNPALSIYGSYITIQDLRISGTGRCGTVTAADSSITAWEQTVPNVNGSSSTGHVGFVARGLYIDAGRGLGIKVRQDHALVEDCEIHNSLESFNNTGSVYRNNVTYGHDQFGSTVFAKGGTRNVQIYNNVIHVTGSDWTEGLLLGGSTGAQWAYDPATVVECYNCVAYNNVVINETGRSRDVFVMAGCKDCTFLNNIGINGATSMRAGGGRTYATTNATWQNNILTIPGDPGLTDDWHLTPWSGYQGAGVAMPTVPAYGGGSLDVSKNKDGVTRTVPWNKGIY